MGFITAAIVGGLVLGAVGVNNAARDARQQRQVQERQIEKQETQARNLARTPTVLEDTGAEIDIGTDGDTSDRQGSTGPRRTTKPRQKSAGTVGGLFRGNLTSSGLGAFMRGGR
jgi:hypothetical protein